MTQKVISQTQWARFRLAPSTLPSGGDLEVDLMSLLKGHIPSLSNWTIMRSLLRIRLLGTTASTNLITVGMLVHPEQTPLAQMPKPDLDDADWMMRQMLPVAPNTVVEGTDYFMDIRSKRRGREFEATVSLLFAETDSAAPVTVTAGGILLIGLH